MDEYAVMKVVNYVRGEVAAGRDPLAGLAAGPGCCADERYLQPVEPQVLQVVIADMLAAQVNHSSVVFQTLFN